MPNGVASSSAAAAYLTKTNIIVPTAALKIYGNESRLIQEGFRDLDERLTGALDGGAVHGVTSASAATSGPTVTRIQAGDATAGILNDEVQLVTLPEDVEGTFSITVNLTVGGMTDTASGLDLDISEADLQTAIDGAGANVAAGDIVVGKIAGRRAFSLKWASAAADNTPADLAVVTVTETQTGASAGVDLRTE